VDETRGYFPSSPEIGEQVGASISATLQEVEVRTQAIIGGEAVPQTGGLAGASTWATRRLGRAIAPEGVGGREP